MIKFEDWLKIKESSAATRLKTQAALGLAPPVADIFSRATPPPWQVERLTKALKKSHKKKKKKKKKKNITEAAKAKFIDPKMNAFMKSVENLANDLWELKLAKKKSETAEKIKKIMKKHGVQVSDEEEKEEKKKEKNSANSESKKPVVKKQDAKKNVKSKKKSNDKNSSID